MNKKIVAYVGLLLDDNSFMIVNKEIDDHYQSDMKILANVILEFSESIKPNTIIDCYVCSNKCLTENERLEIVESVMVSSKAALFNPTK